MSDFPEMRDVGPGWKNLLFVLDDMLRYVSPEYKVAQVKQKFGSLRFYADYVPKPDESDPVLARKIFNHLIDVAEFRTNKMCEVCGEYGVLVNDGWMAMRCMKHRSVAPSEVNDEQPG